MQKKEDKEEDKEERNHPRRQRFARAATANPSTQRGEKTKRAYERNRALPARGARE
jgi:hypothetical protein